MKIGVHVSIAGSIDLSIDRAKDLSVDTFQIFTRNPRGWKSSDLKETEITNFKQKLDNSNLDLPVCHMPYLPNLSSPRKEVYELSVKTLISELNRCNLLGIKFVVTHIGSHLGTGIEQGLGRVIDGCNSALKNTSGDVMIILENAAGSKNSVGSKFEELQFIHENIEESNRVGFCFDTCHSFAAGYDLRTKQKINETFAKFDKTIGLENLKVVHLNDSKGDLGGGLDRHEHIGLGQIGDDGFRVLLDTNMVKDLPFILETPIDENIGNQENIAKIRSFVSV